MLGKLKNKVTRRNRDELKTKYRKRIIGFSFFVVILILLLPFSYYFNNWMNLYPNEMYNSDNNFQVHVIDVGQGLSTFVRLPSGETILFDTGAPASWDNLNRYLDKVCLKNDNLDYMIISHADSDHCGNASKVKEKYSPTNIYIPYMPTEIETDEIEYYEYYNELYNDLDVKKYNIAGNKLELGDVQITWLAPNRDYYQSSNDYSAVILIRYLDFSIMFMADAGHNTDLSNRVNIEAEIMSFAEVNGIDINVDALLLGHHGSKYSTSLELLEACTPKYAFISVGENSYGHPADDVFKNILAYDELYNTNLIDNIYTTKDRGNIIISVNKTSEVSIVSISNIHEYLFVPFVIVDIIVFLPCAYFLLDSIIIYNKIINNKLFSDEKEKEARL